MKVIVSKSVQKSHPDIESILWDTACVAKEIDPDIRLNGLLVRVNKRAASLDSYSGIAFPHEDSHHRGRYFSHPAGKINISIGPSVDAHNIIVVMAHELRHIGHFHRGRKSTGILGDWSFEGTIEELELDCLDFEQKIVNKMDRRLNCVSYA